MNSPTIERPQRILYLNQQELLLIAKLRPFFAGRSDKIYIPNFTHKEKRMLKQIIDSAIALGIMDDLDELSENDSGAIAITVQNQSMNQNLSYYKNSSQFTSIGLTHSAIITSSRNEALPYMVVTKSNIAKLLRMNQNMNHIILMMVFAVIGSAVGIAFSLILLALGFGDITTAFVFMLVGLIGGIVTGIGLSKK